MRKVVRKGDREKKAKGDLVCWTTGENLILMIISLLIDHYKNLILIINLMFDIRFILMTNNHTQLSIRRKQVSIKHKLVSIKRKNF